MQRWHISVERKKPGRERQRVGVSGRGAWAPAGRSLQAQCRGWLCMVTAADDEGSTTHGYFSSYGLYSVWEGCFRGRLSLVFPDGIFKLKPLCLKCWFPPLVQLTCKTLVSYGAKAGHEVHDFLERIQGFLFPFWRLTTHSALCPLQVPWSSGLWLAMGDYSPQGNDMWQLWGLQICSKMTEARTLLGF